MQLQDRIDTFIKELKQGSHQTSYHIATDTVNLLKHVIGESVWKSASDLMKIVKDESRKIIAAHPSETVIGNMTRRVLKIIREECNRLGRPAEGEHEEPLLLRTESTKEDFTTQDFPLLKSAVIESINELIEELDACVDNIAMQALEHIHANEVILTAGNSVTVEHFLKKAAAKKRKFHVVVVECAPLYDGHKLAKSLAEGGVETTIITDSAVFAMMSRVNKVIVGTHTIMADGGLKAFSGSHAIALAAKYYSVPFVVCASLFKLSPLFVRSYDQESFNQFVSPENVLPFTEGAILSKVQVYNPVFDYVPPDLVTLFISNIGGNAPSYIYRLVSELYSPNDIEL